MNGLKSVWVVPAIGLLLGGCIEADPVTPGRPDESAGTQLLQCRVDVRSGELSCAGQDPALGDGVLGAVIGGQGMYVKLASNNVAYDEATEVFSANVTVQNLSNQVIGSIDGVTADSNGVRIFFVNDPVTTGGTGTVTVRNADGTDDFTGTGQPYFQYAQALAPGRTSLAKTWEWDVPATVTGFSFLVGVSANVPNEAGLEPGGIDFVAQSIAADSLHTCAIDLTGQVYCWGWGQYGRLGNGSTTSAAYTTPQSVQQGSLRFVTIDNGLNFTCALTDTGDAYCWGYGSLGRLGNGGTSNSSVPVKVSGDLKFKQITTGRTFACGLTVSGQAYCWGDNTNAHLGNEDSLHHSLPVPVVGGKTFKHISAGGFHACGVTTDGEAYCWGSSTNGKLGAGSDYAGIGPVREPIKVAGGHTWAAIYAGAQHSCGITVEGEAYCWGSNSNGKVGAGVPSSTTEDFHEPAKVNSSNRFVTLSIGNNHTCGVVTDGRGYCWGSNGRGKLGRGNTSGTYSSPQQVSTISNWTHISAGSDHTCGVTTDGEVYCWGAGDAGRLGTGAIDTTATPLEVTTPSPIAFLNGASAGGIGGAQGGPSPFLPQKRRLEDYLWLAARGTKALYVTRLI